MTDTETPVVAAAVTPGSRATLLAELAAERERQIDWRMLIRTYVEQMFEYDNHRIPRSSEPCAGGVNNWLIRQGIPRMVVSAVDYRVLVQGNEHIPRAQAERSFGNLDPVILADLNDDDLRSQLTASVRQGALWRRVFISNLRQAQREWPNIPFSLTEDLIQRLIGAVPATTAEEEAQAQAASFPVPVPAPAAEELEVRAVMANVLIALPLRLTGDITHQSDETLQQQVRSRLRDSLRRSVAAETGVGLTDEILFQVSINRR